jgi:DNA-binding CsgD family transcriptional regulator
VSIASIASQAPHTDAPETVQVGLPNQRVRALRPVGADRRDSTVLVVDPVGALGDALRPALIQFAACAIVQARSVPEVSELIASGLSGELALVNVRFHGHTRPVIRALREAGWPRILALTTASAPVSMVMDAVEAGASGVLRIAGVVDPEPDPLNPSDQLTARELEVVRLVADGWSNKAIGRQLSLSSLTVKNHLARIGRKFGVGDRAHIVAIACRGGVIAGLPGGAYGELRYRPGAGVDQPAY